jgi:threonine dehydrogenase-like Zn-dependent dehydrogenase
MALKLLETRRVNVDGLITHRFALADAGEAVKMAASAESLKVAISI